MSDQVVSVGDKLHIMMRRLFEDDIRRHFVGEVTEVSGALAAVRGYTFVFEPGPNEYQRLPGQRTRIVSLSEFGYVVTRIPREAAIDQVTYRAVDGRVVVADGSSFSLPISEFGPKR
jgi:hypothetical protein